MFRYTYKQVADLAGMSEAAVKQAVHRGDLDITSLEAVFYFVISHMMKQFIKSKERLIEEPKQQTS